MVGAHLSPLTTHKPFLPQHRYSSCEDRNPTSLSLEIMCIALDLFYRMGSRFPGSWVHLHLGHYIFVSSAVVLNSLSAENDFCSSDVEILKRSDSEKSFSSTSNSITEYGNHFKIDWSFFPKHHNVLNEIIYDVSSWRLPLSFNFIECVLIQSIDRCKFITFLLDFKFQLFFRQIKINRS